MKLAFVVNEVATEIDQYTTTRLARAAARRGHEVWYLGIGDVRYQADDRIAAHAHRAIYEEGDKLADFLERAQQEESRDEILLDGFDTVMLRNDTVADLHERPWAVTAAIEFGYTLVERGVTVLNDPAGLSRAASKLYLQDFPPEIRPHTVITRNQDDIMDFVKETGPTVIKPLNGAQGRKVFMVESASDPNLHQAIEAVLEEGYVTAQARVVGDEEGDIRLFLLDGDALEVDGTYAAVRRVPRGSDPRANISAGGKPVPARISETQLGVVAKMRDRLRQDGMFFVGIDLIDDKVIEINVESAGGLQSVERLTEVDFCPVVIEAVERRVEAR